MPFKSEIIIEETLERLSAAAAGLFAMRGRECIQKKSRFTVALSGGSTPKGMYRVLAGEPFLSETPWPGIHVWWVDERCVAPDNLWSNYGEAKRNFLDRVALLPGHIHPMPAEMVPEQGARSYEDELTRYFELNAGEFPVFDLIFLGIGRDGHTASLFPGQEGLKEKKRLVIAVKGGDPNVDRLTLTLPVLNRARQVVFLVSGKEKAEIVKAVLGPEKVSLPAQRVRPAKGRLTWILDQDAASLISD
ncbi:MAG: 6-phosphogluconolactonase [Deltaproteobacteria bacterium]